MAHDDSDSCPPLISDSLETGEDEIREAVPSTRVRRHSTDGRFVALSGDQTPLKKTSNPRMNRSDETSDVYKGPLFAPETQLIEMDQASPVYTGEESNQSQSIDVPNETSLPVNETLSNRIKLSIEDYLDQRVLWWPFSEPLRPARSRYDMPLDSEEQEATGSSDGQTSEALGTLSDRSINRRHNTTGAPSHSGNLRTSASHTTPTLQGPSTSATSGTSTGVSSTPASSTTQRQQGSNITTNQVGRQVGRPNRYIYLCVNAGPDAPEIFEIDVTSLNEDDFVSKVSKIYYKRAGSQSFWAMTDVSRVEFRKITRMSDMHNEVTIGARCIPPNTVLEWSMDRSIDQDTAERIVSRHLRQHTAFPKRPQRSQEVFLPFIPKKGPNSMSKDHYTEGYAMLACPELALWRVLVMLLLYTIPGLAYVVWRLYRDLKFMGDALALAVALFTVGTIHWQIAQRIGTLGGPRIL